MTTSITIIIIIIIIVTLLNYCSGGHVLRVEFPIFPDVLDKLCLSFAWFHLAFAWFQ